MLRLVAVDAETKASSLFPLPLVLSNYIESIKMKEYIRQADIRITCIHSHRHTLIYFISIRSFFFQMRQKLYKWNSQRLSSLIVHCCCQNQVLPVKFEFICSVLISYDPPILSNLYSPAHSNISRLPMQMQWKQDLFLQSGSQLVWQRITQKFFGDLKSVSTSCLFSGMIAWARHIWTRSHRHTVQQPASKQSVKSHYCDTAVLVTNALVSEYYWEIMALIQLLKFAPAYYF